MKYMSLSSEKNVLQTTLLLIATILFGVILFNFSPSSGISIVPERALAIGGGVSLDFSNLDFSNLGLGAIATTTTTTTTVTTSDSVIAVGASCNGGHCWDNSSTADKVCQMNGYDYADTYVTTTTKLTNSFCSWATSSGGWWSCDYSCSSCSVSIKEVSCLNNVIVPPLAPALTSSGEGVVNVSSVTLIMVSTDPQGYAIRYQIDKDADGTIDFYVPPTGYLASGTTQEVIQPNIAAGSYPVRVRTESEQGLVSAWSANTIVVSNVEPDPPTILQFCAY